MCVYLYTLNKYTQYIYPKRLIHFFCPYMCSLGIEPTTFALLTQCSTTEPQEHKYTQSHSTHIYIMQTKTFMLDAINHD